MHLLDTPVVLALRHGGREETGLSGWARSVARDSLFLSAASLLELEQRAAHGRHHGARSNAAKRGEADRGEAERWRIWIDEHVLRAFGPRILPVDAAVARRAGSMALADARDGVLAATALEHGLTLATMRPRAFKGSGARLFDPTTYAPAPSVEDWRQAAQAAPAWIKGLFLRS